MKRNLGVGTYIFVVLLALMTVAALVSIAGNLLTSFPLIANVKWLVAIAFSFLGFWLVRKNRLVEAFKTVVFLAVQFLVVLPSWFTGGGDNSITILYAFLMAVEALLVFEAPVLKWFMVILNMAMLIGCLILVNWFPHWVSATHVSQNVLLDSLLQVVLIFLLTAVSVNIYISNYRKQHLLLKSANAGLERAATIDELSQVFNRRKFFELFAQLRQQAAEQELFLLMIDLDYFKAINDQRGHPAGDRIIHHFASHLLSVIGNATIGRYGGDEFIVLFTALPRQELAPMLKCILAIPPLGEIHLTASAGLSKLLPPQTEAEAIHAADELLLLAKRNGRNQAAMYDGTTVQPE